MVIDYSNRNRYRVVLKEVDGTKTAYHFSTPIYNKHTRKAVDLKFQKKDNTVCAVGSNATVTVTDVLRMENAEGICTIPLHKTFAYISAQELRSGNIVLRPTMNGAAIRVDAAEFSFDLELDKPFQNVRANDKYFSLMQKKFQPFVTVSCM